MSQFLFDDFTTGADNASISNRVPSPSGVGTKWSIHPSSSGTPRINGTTRGLRSDSSSGNVKGIAFATATPASADYTLTLVANFLTLVTGDYVGAYARLSATAHTGVRIRFVVGTGLLLEKVLSGTVTAMIAAYTGYAPTAGDITTFTLTVTGNSWSAGVNGSTVITPLPGDASISLANQAGLIDLTASASTDSTSVQIQSISAATSAVPTQLAMTTQPGNGVTGAALATQPVVAVEDVGGATVATDTSTVTAVLNVISGSGTAIGTLTKAAVAGSAAFSGLGVTGAGTFSWTFTDGSLTSVTSATFTVGAASQLVITGQPTSGVSQSALGTFTVNVETSGGSLVTSDTGNVTASLSMAGCQLQGTPTVAAVGGVATFTNIIPRGSGAFTLTFSRAGLTPAVSAPVPITPKSSVCVVTGS